jgi:hypothetical protein
VFGDAGGSGSPASNTLDSYEEGTWTATVGGNNLTSHDVNVIGTYTKIGDMVYLSGELEGIDASIGLRYFVFNAPFPQYTSDHSYMGTCTNYPHGKSRAGIVVNNSGSDITGWYVSYTNESAQSSSSANVRFFVAYKTSA